MHHILVVEDERDLNDLLAEQLRREGYRVSQVFDGEAALEAVSAGGVDLVVLDWMLPKLDGLGVLRRVRSMSLVLVLMLTARGQDIDIVNGLEAGADDYLPKPAHMRVLRARIAALLRRTNHAAAGNPTEPDSRNHPLLEVAGLAVDRDSRAVTFLNERLEITPTEFELIELFCSNPGRAFSRDYLLERVWAKAPEVGVRTVDTHIQRLRKKLGDGDKTIQTVWGLGYRVRAD